MSNNDIALLLLIVSIAGLVFLGLTCGTDDDDDDDEPPKRGPWRKAYNDS